MLDVPLDEYEVMRINRAQVAIQLHKLPSEIDAMSVQDFVDVLGVIESNKKVDQVSRRRGGA